MRNTTQFVTSVVLIANHHPLAALEMGKPISHGVSGIPEIRNPLLYFQLIATPGLALHDKIFAQSFSRSAVSREACQTGPLPMPQQSVVDILFKKERITGRSRMPICLLCRSNCCFPESILV
ncbi:MAG: hypothetical protein INH43_16850 [Acidobacteriaceae bacterium]|nr:hypothetical protein [Acidobacteriaceae bacterium]